MSGKAKYAPGTLAGLLHSWRYFFAFIALLGAVSLFYFEENWRGPRAWEKYKRRQETRGERFDAKAFIPLVVPPSENFAMTPFLAPLFDFIPGTQKYRSTNQLAQVQGFAPEFDRAARAVKAGSSVRSNSWLTKETDLVAWRAAYLETTNRATRTGQNRPTELSVSRKEAAEEVLANLEECRDVLEELLESSKRKYSRFNLRYDNDDPAAILLPHLAVLKHICQVLQLRAMAKLAVGKSEEAFSDVNLMFRVAEAARNEPTLISQFVRLPMLYMALEPLAEGFGQWSNPQLKGFQRELQQLDFCADVNRSLHAEEVLFGGGIIEFLRRDPGKFEALSGDKNFPGGIWSAVPNGWFDLEKVNYMRSFDEFVLPSIDITNRRISPSACRQAEERITAISKRSRARLFLRHRAFCSLLMPGVLNAARKTAFGQTAADTAGIACAVERYKLAHGELPESLEQLVPEFLEKLPHDIITGQPLKYSRTQDGHYVIYSVGWDEKDDGGVAGFKKGEHDVPEERDWVWR